MAGKFTKAREAAAAAGGGAEIPETTADTAAPESVAPKKPRKPKHVDAAPAESLVIAITVAGGPTIQVPEGSALYAQAEALVNLLYPS